MSEEGKKYLWYLLNKAISAPSADVVDFKALRSLLEASIEHVSEPKGDKLTEFQKKQKKIQEEFKQLGDKKVVVSVGLPEEGICVSTDPVSLHLSGLTGKPLHDMIPRHSRDNKVHSDKSHQISDQSNKISKSASSSILSNAKPSKSSENVVSSPTTERHNSSISGSKSQSSLSHSTSKLGQTPRSKMASASMEIRVNDRSKTFIRSNSNLSTSKSPRNVKSSTNMDDNVKIEKKGIFSHKKSKSNIESKSKEMTGTSVKQNETHKTDKKETEAIQGSSMKDKELAVVVNLPRNLICENKETTEIKLSIADGDTIVTKVSQGGELISPKGQEDVHDERKKSKEQIHADSKDEKKIDRNRSKSNISEKTSKSRHEEESECRFDKTTDSAAYGTTTDNSEAETSGGTAITRKASKESVWVKVSTKDKKEIGSSKREKSMESTKSTSRRRARDGSKDSKKSTATKSRKGDGSSKRGTSVESSPRRGARGLSKDSRKSTVSGGRKTDSLIRGASVESLPTGRRRTDSRDSKKSASKGVKDVSGLKRSLKSSAKAKSASKDQQGFSSGISPSSMSESESESVRVQHISRDRTDLRKEIYKRQRTGTGTVSGSSVDQSPRGRAVAKDIMKRPQISPRLPHSKMKHLSSIMEADGKRKDLYSKLKKYQMNGKPEPFSFKVKKGYAKELPIAYKKCECNALRNTHECTCDPEVCLKPLASRRNPRVCFCANSYMRGSDGVVYHTKCNCFDD